MDNEMKTDSDSSSYKKPKNSLIGFCLGDLTSWDKIVRLLCRPEDPSSLAVFRIAFGFLMVLDIGHERGFAYIDHVYGSTADICKFPLFDFLKPMSVLHMSVIYTAMLFGAVGICLGFRYRLASIVFTFSYWYVFLLDKTRWNNHSYLYGLIGLMMCVFDAHHFWSIHGFFDKRKCNTHVPLWQYFVLRTQIFFVYFIAGLKKSEYDWLAGYSFSTLGEHWVFAPFRLFLPTKLVTWLVIHGSGFIIDSLVGFFLFFDKTRLVGTLIVTAFHLMNSQIFAIGVFPWTMLVTTTIFYANDWPKRVFLKRLEDCSILERLYSTDYERVTPSNRCIYTKQMLEDEAKNIKPIDADLTLTPMHANLFHKIASALSILYILVQAFLPYSHFITKGYNGWTQGLYGYSWDMMVHSCQTQHIKILVKNLDTQEVIYLDPKAFTSSRRWSSHPDMIKQHANCIGEYIRKHDKNWQNIAVKMDIWRSLNARFIQRQVDPNVDLLTANWSPFSKTEWIIPLMQNLSHWRTTLQKLDESIKSTDYVTEISFVSDIPGLTLENYIDVHMNTALIVIDGKIKVEIPKKNKQKRVVRLNAGQHVHLPSAAFHKIRTISKTPSCFLYAYRNETDNAILETYKLYKDAGLREINKTMDGTLKSSKRNVDNPYDWNIKQSQTATSAKLWYTSVYGKLKQTNVSELLAQHSDPEFMQVLTEEHPTLIEDSILSALNTSIREISQSRTQRILQIIHNVYSFFTAKARQYRRVLFVITLTCRCLITGEALDELLLEKHDLKYT